MRELRIAARLRQGFVDALVESQMRLKFMQNNFGDYRQEVHLELANFFNDVKAKAIARVRGLVCSAFAANNDVLSIINNGNSTPNNNILMSSSEQ